MASSAEHGKCEEGVGCRRVRASEDGGGTGIDLAAFLIGLPGLAAIALGLDLRKGSSNRYRSLMGILSLSNSLIISALGIPTYLATVVDDDFGDLPRSMFFYVNGWPWIVLLSLAIINAVWSVITLATRVLRYLRCLKSPNDDDRSLVDKTTMDSLPANGRQLSSECSDVVQDAQKAGSQE